MRTILCVDDHQPTLFTLCLIFRRAGYHCLGASNFEEAVQAFASSEISLVIVDHGLPGMNGSVLAGYLKDIRNVAVIMLSGNPELTGVPKSVNLLLPKPIAPQVLLKAAADLIESWR